MLLIREEGKKHYGLIKQLNTFLYDYTLYRGAKHFCRYCLQDFRTAETLTSHIKDLLIVSKGLSWPNKLEYVRFKNCERIIKSPFMIYVDFESILVREDIGKQNPTESYTNKYPKHDACSYAVMN